MTILVHHLENNRSRRVLRLLGALGLAPRRLLGEPAVPRKWAAAHEQLVWPDAEPAGRAWFAGDASTGADVMGFPVEAARSRPGCGADDLPKLAGWPGPTHARPACAGALERSGRYAWA